jgi:hypothetical protein
VPNNIAGGRNGAKKKEKKAWEKSSQAFLFACPILKKSHT